jgi:hypothetical protein
MEDRLKRLVFSLLLVASSVVSASALTVAWGTVAAHAVTGSVNVYVGYADSLRSSPTNFPTPWNGDTGVTFEGCTGCAYDAGAVRVVNTSGATETIDSVTVTIDTCTYDIWPHGVSLPAGGQLVITQTVPGATSGCTSDGLFDTSDVGPGGSGYAGNCTPDGIKPTVDVSVNGTDTTYTDSAQVINTGGFDLASCPLNTNESTQWQLIGGSTCAGGATLTLAPASQLAVTGSTATVTATFTNNCTPPQGLQGATVNFTVISGPNTGAGGVGTSPTDANGQASFTYSSALTGTDTLQASVTNAAGTITSNNVTVTWFNAAPGGGSFVIGDKESAVGTSVTFWGSQWWKVNAMSGGSGPAAFKGFAGSPETPACGTAWSADPGNSTPPPAGPLPAYMAIIVSSSVGKSGSSISGDTPHIVIVKTNPGYAPDPGHAGTGTVVGIVC